MVKRKDIRGKTFKLPKGYDIEVVTVKRIPRTIALSKNRKTIRRFPNK